MYRNPRFLARRYNDSLGHRLHFIPAQHIPAVQPEHGAGHEGGVLQDEHHGLDDVFDGAGAAEQGVAEDGILLSLAQQPPAAGARPVAGFDKTEHDLVDAHLGCGLPRPGFGEQRHGAAGGGIAVVEHRRRRPRAADQAGDRGEVDHGPRARSLQEGQGGGEHPALGPEGGLHLEVPLLADIRPMDDRPAAALDVVDQ